MTAAPDAPFPTVLHMLDAAARAVPDRLALVCGADRLSYGAYRACIAALAAELRAGGVRPGDRVVTLMANSADAAIASFAVHAAGAQLVPLNPAYTVAELQPVIADAAPVAILHDDDLADRLAQAAPAGLRRIAIGPASRRLTVLPPVLPPVPPLADVPALELPQPDWPATLQYTGGTTGRPKGVSLTHAAIAINVAQREALLPTRDAEQVMCITPLFHVYAVSMGLYLAANCRGTLHVVRKFDAAAVLASIARDRIGFLSASPTIFLGLMRDPAFATADLSALRVCSSGSAALPEDVLRRWEAVTGCPVCEGYGQTEAGPVLTYNPLEGVRKAGSVGVPVPGTEVQIVDPETGTRVLPTGETGEIRARGPQIMTGYRNRPAETAEALRDGWLYTGDIGRMDDDGYLTICDRKKDMVVTAGYNVYPREIEELLFALPGVADAAVVGVPDPYRGEALVALVVPGEPAPDPQAIQDHLGARLTRYKWPRELRLVPALPKTAVAKTDKAAIRRQLQAETAAQVAAQTSAQAGTANDPAHRPITQTGSSS